MVRSLAVAPFLLAVLIPLQAANEKSKPAVYRDKPLSEWVKLLKSDKPTDRDLAAYALGQMGTAAKSAGPELAALLKDPDGKVKARTAFSLGLVGNESTIPALVLALGDKDNRVGQRASASLARFGEPALGQVIAALKSSDDNTRRYAVAALAQMGPRARAAVSSLKPLLQDKNPKIAKEADATIKKIEAEPVKKPAAAAPAVRKP
jgi:HEAT repeat protein